MGNKMKKLICALLASAMLVSSVGMVAFADEPAASPAPDAAQTEATQAPAAEATEAPAAEATEAPVAEATQAPTAEATQAPIASDSNSAYDNDNYYQKALALCSSLGIISGYEDGSVKPDSKVTRAEMASIVLRMLAITSNSTYQNGFTDVTSAHWAANQIQTAQEAGIINGMGDGTFVPDGEVTYAQVIVMIVNAMNYKADAEYYGGWPTGYIKAAGLSDLNLLKNAPGEQDVPSDRGVVIKMVYNALLGQYKDITGYSNGFPTYSAEKTLAEAKFDLIEEKGTLLATSKTSVSGTDLQEGQIEIRYTNDDKEEETEVYDCALTGLEDYLSQKIVYYYRENSGLTPEVLAVAPDTSKSDSITIDSDEIEKVQGFEDGEGSIKIEKVSKAKDCTGAEIIYNGKKYDDADNTTGKTLDELLKPEKGTLRLVDGDNDGKYETVFVDAYEIMIVTSAGTDRLTGKVSDATSDEIGATKAMSLNLDDSEDRTVTVTKAGAEVKLRNLKKNDVATIKRSLDDTVVDIVVTGESITGSASAVSKKLDNSHATVNGEKYEVANIAVDDLKSGSQSVFYLDNFGRIAFIEASSADGQLQAGEKYGWIMNAYDSESGEDFYVQMMTSEGKEIEMKLSTKLEYWAPDATEETQLSGDEVKDTINTLITSNAFITTTIAKKKVPIRLVKYKANSSDTITRLYCAVDSTVVDDDDAVRIDPTNLNAKPVAGGLVNGYKIEDGLFEISVPKDPVDMKDADNYKFGEAIASVYVVRENGSSRDYIVGEFSTSTTPTLLINFTTSADALASLGDIDTNGNNPVMVVEDVEQGIDDDDNVVYTVSGYVNGTEASFTTTKNSILGKIDPSQKLINGDRDYATTALWNAKGEGNLTDFLDEGDLILYDSGDRIIKLLDTDDVHKVITSERDENGVTAAAKTDKVLFGAFQPFPARNMFAFGGLVESELDSTSWVQLDDFGVTPPYSSEGSGPIANSNLGTISFDSSKLMDTVEISLKSGKATIDTEGSEISDLVNFDKETLKGDYIFARFADKGTLQEMIVFRFVD